MHPEKIFPLAKGLLRKIILRRQFDKSTGGTNDSRYCYSVWLRHFVFAHENGVRNIGGNIAELGPGDSLGIGLTGLLTGHNSYYALDVHQYWDIGQNLKIFEDLVTLLRQKTPIPDDKEFPKVTPSLKDYSFPSHILTDAVLGTSLADERLNQIRTELKNLDKQESNEMIRYFIPWNDTTKIQPGSVDFIYSQAVLQYVDDLDATYRVMSQWLKPGGLTSHSIDFSSHGITKSWNGHWLFTDAEWKLIHGNNKILLNRKPQSHHLHLAKKHNFELINKMDYRRPSKLPVSAFAKEFQGLSRDDVGTSVMVAQFRKKQSGVMN